MSCRKGTIANRTDSGGGWKEADGVPVHGRQQRDVAVQEGSGGDKAKAF